MWLVWYWSGSGDDFYHDVYAVATSKDSAARLASECKQLYGVERDDPHEGVVIELVELDKRIVRRS